MTSKRDRAIELAQQNFRVFPLVPNGKTPANEGNWRRAASADPARVHEMWTCPVTDAEQDYNIGIALPADVMVFDEDTRNGKTGDKSRQLLEAIYEPLPDTFTVISASGGRHRYYKAPRPVSNSASKIAQHIDIKSEGGFVVAAGSVIDGKAYEAIDAAPIADAPGWLLTLAGAPKERKVDSETPLVDLDSEAAIARAVDWLTTKAPEAGTYAVAARVKDFGVSQDRCTELLLDHWPPGESKGEEHVAFRVANAYQYGQNAPGIASAEAEFGPVEIDQKPPPKRKGLYPVYWDAAVPTLDQPYLIDDVMDLGAMVVTYGDSNAGKTYVKLDQCFHIATGRDWNGHKVRQGVVVYVAAEGGKGFLKRIAAFKKHYGTEDVPFALVPCPIDLFSQSADTAKLVNLIREVEARYGQKCIMVVIDTLARAMAGGDENLAKDMGQFVDNIDRLRAATGATADIIHHTGKDKAKGARGSSALRAATDTELEVQPGVLTVAKQRDLQKVDDFNFKLLSVDVGRRPDGKPVTACVVQWVKASEFDDAVSPLAQDMLEVLERLIAEEQDRIDTAEGMGKGDKSDIWIPWQMWQMSLMSCLKGARGGSISRSVLFRTRLELSQTRRVRKNQHNQWTI